jgi:hypothetical protein
VYEGEFRNGVRHGNGQVCAHKRSPRCKRNYVERIFSELVFVLFDLHCVGIRCSNTMARCSTKVTIGRHQHQRLHRTHYPQECGCMIRCRAALRQSRDAYHTCMQCNQWFVQALRSDMIEMGQHKSLDVNKSGESDE